MSDGWLHRATWEPWTPLTSRLTSRASRRQQATSVPTRGFSTFTTPAFVRCWTATLHWPPDASAPVPQPPGWQTVSRPLSASWDEQNASGGTHAWPCTERSTPSNWGVVKTSVRAVRKLHFSARIENCSNTKQLFSVSNGLLGKSKTTPLPSDIPRSALHDRFCMFFSQKIQNIRQDLDAHPSEPATFSAYDSLCLFQPVTEEEIRKLIVESPTKTCMLDPIPTSLTKECLSDLLPLITRIVNSSLCSGAVPPQFKQAVVTPLLKKPGLDPNDLKNFRPVSNLSFISKILEKVVLTQLQKHLSESDLLEIRQSAYRKNHSTETALLSIVDGLLRNADHRLFSVLALLDLSAAFLTHWTIPYCYRGLRLHLAFLALCFTGLRPI